MKNYPTDPDEFCTHCYRPVYSLYRLCPWCGEVWDSNTADEQDHDGQCRDDAQIVLEIALYLGHCFAPPAVSRVASCMIASWLTSS